MEGNNNTTEKELSLAEKKNARFQQKHTEMLERLQRKREEHQKAKDDDFDALKASDQFNREFTSEFNKIKNLFTTTESLEKDNIKGHLDGTLEAIKGLQTSFVDSTIFLSKYDQKTYREQLDGMLKTHQDQSDLHLPRKKFKFGMKKKAKPTETKKPQQEDSKTNFKEEAKPIVSSVRGQTLTFSNTLSDEEKMSFRVKDLDKCVVTVTTWVKAVYLENIKDCEIYLGPIAGACFVRGCKNCVIHLAAHQLRIHNAEDSQFHILTRSKPIIEHSTRLIFSPYKIEYSGVDQDLQSSGLYQIDNLWREVQDFNWLKKEASPNFELRDLPTNSSTSEEEEKPNINKNNDDDEM
eukprot:CAMPEP_0115013796 /NCGR_PEP_ID=MMETSP0216-20121206/25647_1 /TAXON_ID=223996 /ORGANISM="Protocruzia adherens, Strain Boccale" /LENGTH=350 /DNA_ID=CAMNT_0002383315 /DNA_START=141 /DNA_END=1193 /DNA_ORIENTATION=+